MKKKISSQKKDEMDYAEALKIYEWDDLAHDLIKLELEYENIKKHLTTDKLKQYQRLIAMYEQEKARRVTEEYDHSRRTDYPGDAMAGWMEVTDEDLENI